MNDADREAIETAARGIAAGMPPWTAEQLDELARIAESAPRAEGPHATRPRSA